MAVKCNSINCPSCTAPIEVEAGRREVFCMYCGSRVQIEYDNEQVFRSIDEAELRRAETEMKRAETDRQILLKKMELLEKKRQDEKKAKNTRIGIALGLAVAGVILMIVGSVSLNGNRENTGKAMMLLIGMMLLSGALLVGMESFKKSEEDDLEITDRLRIPDLGEYKKRSYASVEAQFTGAGFTDVRCVPLNDLALGLIIRPGMVESVTINGRGPEGMRKADKDAAVVITYHSRSYR